MLKEVVPQKKRSGPPSWIKGKAYVRYTPKMLYLSGPAMQMLGMPEKIGISIDGPQRMMIIRPNGPFKLSTVCETQNARRIETNLALMSLLDAGFPKGMINKYLSVSTVTMDGALCVSLVPEYDRIPAESICNFVPNML